jgi:hypothetical protein
MTTNIRNATDLWIEAGPIDDDPRHHVPVPNALAEFFDAESRDAEVVYVRLPNGSVLPRPLVHRGADVGQSEGLWHLSLPTKRMGAPSFAGRVIRLTRQSEASRSIYVLNVDDACSSAAVEWDRAARSSGNIGETAGPPARRYGYW